MAVIVADRLVERNRVVVNHTEYWQPFQGRILSFIGINGTTVTMMFECEDESFDISPEGFHMGHFILYDKLTEKEKFTWKMTGTVKDE